MVCTDSGLRESGVAESVLGRDSWPGVVIGGLRDCAAHLSVDGMSCRGVCIDTGLRGSGVAVCPRTGLLAQALCAF